jgi:UDP-N-acetylglucosamine 2-epimerase (non-hydrolysing)
MLLARDPQLDAWVPMHPSPNVRSVLTARLGSHPRVRLTEPLGYRAFVQALADAALILTDSGGVQEECAALGRPVLVMREDTERPEALEAGVAILVGTDTAQIVETGAGLLDDAERYRRMARPSAAFGHGGASVQILDAMLRVERQRAASA